MSVPIHFVVPCVGGPITSRHDHTGKPGVFEKLGGIDQLRIIPAGTPNCNLAILCSPRYRPTSTDRLAYTGEPDRVTCPNCRNHPQWDEVMEHAKGTGQVATDPSGFLTTEDMKKRLESSVAATVAVHNNETPDTVVTIDTPDTDPSTVEPRHEDAIAAESEDA